MGRLAGYGGNVLVGTQLVEDCEDVWDELVDGDVTASLDTSDFKIGSGSAKFVCAAGLAVGDIIATEVVVSVNLSTYTELLFWAKSSVDINTAGDLQLLVDNHAQCVSPEVTLNIPTLTAATWKFCKATGTFTNATAIISVGLKLTANDPGAFTVWLDDIRAAKAIVGIKSWTLDDGYEVQEGRAFSDAGAPHPVVTITNWGGSFEGFKDGAPIARGTLVSIELQESSTATQQWRGNAIITARHPNVAIDGLVTYSYDFVGYGALVEPTT